MVRNYGDLSDKFGPLLSTFQGHSRSL